MARKKPLQYIPREERPEFLALVAELMNVRPEQFPDIARQCAEQYHDAVLAGHVEVLDQMEMAYTALVYQLNGGTMQGCAADDSRAAMVLARVVAAKPGQVPCWGQDGEFLLEVDGLRLRVVLTPDMLGNHHGCALHAVDLDKPFINTEGFRAAILTATACLGETVDQAARRLVLELLQAEGGAKPIDANAWARTHPQKVPGWLADAQAGVRSDGQLAMFGDAPKDPEAKVPLTNAQRQKAFRQRQRELKAEGAKSVLLSRDEWSVLWCAVDVWVTVRKDLNLLESTYYREALTRVFKDSPWWAKTGLEALGNDSWVQVTAKQEKRELKRAWDAYAAERKCTERLVNEVNQARAENRRLQNGLQEIAAEIGGASAVPAKTDEVAELRRHVASLERENALLESERNGSLAAVKVYVARLQNAGLPTNYRKQPGE